MSIHRYDLAVSISDRLNVLAWQLKTRSRSGLFDANHSLEFVMARFFNALLGWNFADLNAQQHNFPAADLGDHGNRIAMQVTNEDSSRKIRDTVDKAIAHGLANDFDRLIIFFLLPRKPRTLKSFTRPSNCPEIECWDLADLLRRMKNLPDVNALAMAASILQQELGAFTAANVGPWLRRIPPPPEGFVGRKADLEELRSLKPASGVMLAGFRGMGGIGKTALALVLAHEWTARFPDAQLFLDGCGLGTHPPSPADLLAQVIRIFRPEAELPTEVAALKAIYSEVLRERRVLILLDNASSTAQATPLIPPTGCALIVTSRQTIILETVKPHSVGMLHDAEASALLREYHPPLTENEAAKLAELCAGLPLALRLAGAHLAMGAAEGGEGPNVAAYLEALGKNRERLLNEIATDVGIVSVSETLRLSEEQLGEAERAMWRRLGNFAASFDPRAAEAVAGADEVMLTRFVRRSLLEREGGERYRLHDLAADYARARIAADEFPYLHLAHARHYAKVASEAEAAYLKGGDDLLRGLELFDRERTHLENAFAWLRPRTDDESFRALVDLAGAMPWLCVMRLHPRIRIEWQTARLNAARALNSQRDECGALSGLGIAWRHLGGAREAADCHDAQLAIAEAADEKYWMCNALNNLGNCHQDLGNSDRAIACYVRAYSIARELPDEHRRWVAYSLNHLGHMGPPGEAVALHEQALTILRAIGDLRGVANTLGNLSITHRKLRDLHSAIDYAKQQATTARTIGDQRAECNALGNHGRALFDSGMTDEALAHFAYMKTLSREIGYRRGEAHALWHSALCLDSLGERAEALTSVETALAIYEAVNDPRAAIVRTQLTSWRQEQSAQQNSPP